MKRPGVIGCLAISCLLFGGIRAVEYAGQGRFHWGAPPLVYHCPPGHTLVTRWEKGTEAAGQPGTVSWHGYTEYGACQDSLTIDGG